MEMTKTSIVANNGTILAILYFLVLVMLHFFVLFNNSSYLGGKANIF